ncbi:MAG: hypothetical protein KKF44_02070 [Nanoarchaeota archaeon]|nr:hypothetical protein [Nanoarchaeota archaeon]
MKLWHGLLLLLLITLLSSCDGADINASIIYNDQYGMACSKIELPCSDFKMFDKNDGSSTYDEFEIPVDKQTKWTSDVKANFDRYMEEDSCSCLEPEIDDGNTIIKVTYWEKKRHFWNDGESDVRRNQYIENSKKNTRNAILALLNPDVIFGPYNALYLDKKTTRCSEGYFEAEETEEYFIKGPTYLCVFEGIAEGIDSPTSEEYCPEPFDTHLSYPFDYISVDYTCDISQVDYTQCVYDRSETMTEQEARTECRHLAPKECPIDLDTVRCYDGFEVDRMNSEPSWDSQQGRNGCSYACKFTKLDEDEVWPCKEEGYVRQEPMSSNIQEIRCTPKNIRDRLECGRYYTRQHPSGDQYLYNELPNYCRTEDCYVCWYDQKQADEDIQYLKDLGCENIEQNYEFNSYYTDCPYYKCLSRNFIGCALDNYDYELSLGGVFAHGARCTYDLSKFPCGEWMSGMSGIMNLYMWPGIM